ncbi:hypothetical protein OS493_039079, partial [Desmophyllum pertusum]
FHFIQQMSSANVIASAPPSEVESETQSLYPQLPSQPDNFRLAKINEAAATLQQEVTQHRKVGKKYQKVKTILHYTAVGAGTLSGALSAAALPWLQRQA